MNLTILVTFEDKACVILSPVYYSLVVFLPSVEQCLNILTLLGDQLLVSKTLCFMVFFHFLHALQNSSHAFLCVSVVHLVLT